MVCSVALIAVVFAGDYAVLRWRITHPRMGPAFDTVQVTRLLAIPLKNGRTEYELDARQPQQSVTCVHALFSHLGYSPCWYVRRNSQQPIPMVILVRTFRMLRTASGAANFTRRAWTAR